MNIAIVIGDERVHNAAWPRDLNVKTYPANTRDAERVADSARRGGVDVIVTHARWTPPAVRAVLKRQSSARVLTWERGGIPELAANLHEFVGAPPPMPDLVHTEEMTRMPAAPKPYVRVVHASKQPERRPPWSEDERAALLSAYEGAVDFPRVIDGFLDLTRDVDAPVRSQAEIRAEIERLRSGAAQEVDVDELVFALLWVLLGLAVLDRERSRLGSMAAALEHGAEWVDEVRNKAVFLARTLREAAAR